MNTVDITQMSMSELKALAYDTIVTLNQTQQNLNVIQAEIQKRVQESELPEPENDAEKIKED